MNQIAAHLPSPPQSNSGSALKTVAALLLKLRSMLALALLVVFFSSMTSSFLTANNLSILTKHVAITALLAVGTSCVILAGGIDLSVGSVAGLSGMIAGYFVAHGILLNGGDPRFIPVWLAVILALAAGGAPGCFYRVSAKPVS